MIDILLLDAIDVQHVVLRMAPGEHSHVLGPPVALGGGEKRSPRRKVRRATPMGRRRETAMDELVQY